MEYTKEEVENSYIYKITERALKKEFPFIKGIKLSDDFGKYSSLIFIDIFVDLNQIAKLYDLHLNPWSERIMNDPNREEDYSVAYLTIPFTTSEEPKEIQQQIDKTIDAIYKSPVIPDELKLGRKSFSVGEFIQVYPE